MKKVRRKKKSKNDSARDIPSKKFAEILDNPVYKKHLEEIIEKIVGRKGWQKKQSKIAEISFYMTSGACLIAIITVLVTVLSPPLKKSWNNICKWHEVKFLMPKTFEKDSLYYVQAWKDKTAEFYYFTDSILKPALKESNKPYEYQLQVYSRILSSGKIELDFIKDNNKSYKKSKSYLVGEIDANNAFKMILDIEMFNYLKDGIKNIFSNTGITNEDLNLLMEKRTYRIKNTYEKTKDSLIAVGLERIKREGWMLKKGETTEEQHEMITIANAINENTEILRDIEAELELIQYGLRSMSYIFEADFYRKKVQDIKEDFGRESHIKQVQPTESDLIRDLFNNIERPAIFQESIELLLDESTIEGIEKYLEKD